MTKDYLKIKMNKKLNSNENLLTFLFDNIISDIIVDRFYLENVKC